ncbi:1-acyl-sn-glycerol-3-phosphate acyltransferase [Methylophaga lonarensis MPL]|uniref:1-acyl-sn-glycerol-3-phosphate acyltransferase n=1 Tax=Methylophaga lonarensis MPL TaxID=1286106 RepID=M7NZR7_9GAMM|nr:lysophospholipid acyltransferase family protein [Methylophaga lonarensis]EMR14323.1 1-acyl-sn-glycerol-3-phosphate acyltransferase [Methylophaga lonarensis MPL]
MLIFLFILLLLALLWWWGLRHAGADWGGPRVNWIDGWVRLLCRVVHRQGANQLDLPKHGPAIVAANHVSGLDPLLLITASPRPLRFLIAEEEYRKPMLNWLYRLSGCIPVDRQGRPEKALREALRALQQGDVIALFPHGKIHLDTDPPRKLKAGVARLAMWSGAPLLPVRIDGVAGQGKVLLAPLIPGRVQISQYPALMIDGANFEAGMLRLQALIETSAQQTSSAD